MTHEEQIRIAREYGIAITPEPRTYCARMRGASGYGSDPYEALHGLWKHGAMSVWDRDLVTAAISEIDEEPIAKVKP